MEVAQLRQLFAEKFQQQPTVVTASPGRINLIGEHTDYNHGFVLPAAIQFKVCVLLAPNVNGSIRMYSASHQQSFETIGSAHLQASDLQWPNYILGVIEQLQKQHPVINGIDLLIAGDVPVGAGVSSSAALECATVFALNEHFNFGHSKLEMVQMAQAAENEFVGVKCGIMDQFASMFGKAGHVIKLDCDSLEYEYFPFDAAGLEIVLLDTQVKHSLASSEYNTRRKECETGFGILQSNFASVKTFRDVTEDMLQQCKDSMSEKVYNRCLYVVQENARLAAACDDLLANNLASFGQRMFGTHHGLSKLYEVSCAELDFIADACQQQPAVIGARMMGGGFGGCVIALVKAGEVDHLLAAIAPAYQQQFGVALGVHRVAIGDGTRRLQ
jgi:galactokinase